MKKVNILNGVNVGHEYLCLPFTDYDKAFDAVETIELLTVIDSTEGETYCRILQDTYNESTAVIKTTKNFQYEKE